jgi:hypothetical protein
MEGEGWEADVRSSQLEIYNDSVRDLLGEGIPMMDIREVEFFCVMGQGCVVGRDVCVWCEWWLYCGVLGPGT